MNKDLKNIIATGESYYTEFKESFDRSIAEVACAFANSSGGNIILGINDAGVIKGVDAANRVRSQIQDTLGKISPQLEISVKVEGNIIVVEVPEGREKPYGCSRGFFMRVGANTQKMKPDQIIEFYKSEGRIRFDGLINQEASFGKDFDLDSYKYFLKRAKISNEGGPKKILTSLNCLDKKGNFTNAGVLFFVKILSVSWNTPWLSVFCTVEMKK